MSDAFPRYVGVMHTGLHKYDSGNRFDLLSRIKRNMLLFDALYILDLTDLRSESAASLDDEEVSMLDQLQYLEDRRVIKDYTQDEFYSDIADLYEPLTPEVSDFHRQLSHAHGFMAAYHGKMRDLHTLAAEALQREDAVAYEHIKAQIERFSDRGPVGLSTIESLLSRFAAMALKHGSGQNAISLDPAPQIMLPEARTVAKLSDIYTITILHMPIPDHTMPWDEVVAFKEDSDTRRRLAQLRVYLNGLAKMADDYQETLDKVSSSLLDYKDHIKRSRIKYDIGLLESTITGGPEYADLGSIRRVLNLVAKPLFGISRRKAMLTEEEAKAPGKELSYLVKASERFGSEEKSVE